MGNNHSSTTRNLRPINQRLKIVSQSNSLNASPSPLRRSSPKQAIRLIINKTQYLIPIAPSERYRASATAVRFRRVRVRRQPLLLLKRYIQIQSIIYWDAYSLLLLLEQFLDIIILGHIDWSQSTLTLIIEYSNTEFFISV